MAIEEEDFFESDLDDGEGDLLDDLGIKQGGEAEGAGKVFVVVGAAQPEGGLGGSDLEVEIPPGGRWRRPEGYRQRRGGGGCVVRRRPTRQ